MFQLSSLASVKTSLARDATQLGEMSGGQMLSDTSGLGKGDFLH